MILPLLDDQPDMLAPRSALNHIRSRSPSDALVVSTNMSVDYEQNLTVVRIHDVIRDVVRAFELREESFETLRTLVPGERAPEMDPLVRQVLVDAGVLVRNDRNDDVAEDEQVLREGSASLSVHGYAVIPQALHPYEVATVRRYVRGKIRRRELHYGDDQVSHRYYSHNDPTLVELRERFTPLVSRLVRKCVKPSYSYLIAYTEGAVLEPHVDREQCEYSLTIAIDYAPEPTVESSWPLRLATERGEIQIFQALGDALLYAGRRLTHYRSRLTAHHFSTSLLLHYVDSDFKGTLN